MPSRENLLPEASSLRYSATRTNTTSLRPEGSVRGARLHQSSAVVKSLRYPYVSLRVLVETLSYFT
eukprot:scaffold32170_cov18-Prasinocladus_malaysianus.AAC.1